MYFDNKAGLKKFKLALEGQSRPKAVFTFSFWIIVAFFLTLKIFKSDFLKTAPSHVVEYEEKKY